MKALKYLTIAAVAVYGLSSASADEGEIPLSLKGHKFAPAEIHVKANVPNVIVLSNADDTPEEFELHLAEGRKSRREP